MVYIIHYNRFKLSFSYVMDSLKPQLCMYICGSLLEFVCGNIGCQNKSWHTVNCHELNQTHYSTQESKSTNTIYIPVLLLQYCSYMLLKRMRICVHRKKNMCLIMVSLIWINPPIRSCAEFGIMTFSAPQDLINGSFWQTTSVLNKE